MNTMVETNMTNGIINVYKEKGYTSFDVVAKLRGIIGQRKIGHTGTLDPEAEGVLPVCLGNGTKLVDLLTDKHKEYIAELLLGVETDTLDMTGTVLKEMPVNVTEEEVRVVMQSFVGEYDQIPPMYSALKVNGKKLYELAREGKEIDRKARRVAIQELEILELALPVVKFRVACSKGTYIRSLCADIGVKCGTVGTMKSLIRSKVDTFLLEDAHTLDEIASAKMNGTLSDWITSVDQMFPQLQKIHVKEKYLPALKNGNKLFPQFLQERTDGFKDLEKALVYDEQGQFYGIYIYHEKESEWKPEKMFLPD